MKFQANHNNKSGLIYSDSWTPLSTPAPPMEAVVVIFAQWWSDCTIVADSPVPLHSLSWYYDNGTMQVNAAFQS